MSFDYYAEVNAMTEEKIGDEIQRLTKALFRMSPDSPMFQQVQSMLDMAQEAQLDKVYLRKYKNAPTDQALEIGTINSEVKELDYDDQQMLEAMVTAYTANLRDQHE